jgi:hypothetical protein
MDAPLKLYYQCQYHPAMGNIIYIPLDSIDTTLALNLSNNLVVTGTSNVGIGTNNPIGKLDVRGAIIAPVVAFSSNQDEPYLVAGTSAYNGDPGNTGNWNLHGFEHRMKVDGLGIPRITVDDGLGNEVFTIKNGGNIGIGASTPQYKLDVDGGTTEGAGDVMLRLMGAVNKTGKLILGRSGNTDIRSHAIEVNNNTGGANNFMKFLVHDGGSSSPYETRTEVMTLLGDGNVGIGTASPRALLDVCGPVGVPAILTSGAGSTEGDIAVLSGEAMQIGHWDNNATPTPTFTTRIHISGGSGVEGNVGIANTSPQHKLSVGGSIRHTGLVLSEGTNIDQITLITKTLGVTVSWMDTGISGTNLVTGSYIVQIENHSDAGGSNRNYNEYYTGFMSWYSESNGTNDTDASEIILHAAGHATEDNHIYLRVLRQLSGVLKLQIRRDIDRSNHSVDYKFKFRRMM